MASGTFSRTDFAKAEDISVATYRMLTPSFLTRFQNSSSASAPLPSPACKILTEIRSTTMVLYTCPLLTANSSIPMLSIPLRDVLL